MDDTDFLIPVSVFENKDDNRPSRHEMAWHAFAQRLCRYDERPSKDGKAWSPVTYLPGTTRGKHNVDMVYALVLDIDYGNLPVDLLEGREMVAHTTFQHTPEAPRWRVVLPLASPIKGDAWPEFWLRANAHFGGCVDPATKDSSRIFYLPSCPPGGTHEVRQQHGTLLDPRELPVVPKYELPGQVPGQRRNGTLPSRHLADWAARFVMAKIVELGRMPRDSGRNTACNRAAHTLGGLVADPAHDLRTEWVVEQLMDACYQNQLVTDDGERSVRATIQSGLESGLTRAWSPADQGDSSPVKARGAPHVHRVTSVDPDLLDMEVMRVIEPEEIHWLWPARLARGKLCVLMGDPGLGKSLVTIHCAAVVSTGGTWPDGETSEQGAVVILSAEDGPGDTIRPRLDVAGADIDQVFLLRGIRERPEDATSRLLSLHADRELLELAIRRTNAKLVIIDPLNAYMGGVDSHKAAEVRGILAPLSTLADRTGVAIILVHHLNKGTSANALYRAGGSLDFVAAARSVLGVVPDPERPERKLILSVKLNIAQRPPGLGYEIVPSQLGRANSQPVLRWDKNPVSLDPTQAFVGATTTEQRSLRGEIRAVLQETLKDGEVPSDDCKRAIRLALGSYNETTVRGVRTDMGVIIARRGFGAGGQWVWSLPAIDEHSSTRLQSVSSMPSMPQEVSPMESPRIDANGDIPAIDDVEMLRARNAHLWAADSVEALCPIHHKRFDLHDCDQL